MSGEGGNRSAGGSRSGGGSMTEGGSTNRMSESYASSSESSHVSSVFLDTKGNRVICFHGISAAVETCVDAPNIGRRFWRCCHFEVFYLFDFK